MSRPAILFVEQSSELGGAQLGLLDLLPALREEFSTWVAVPGRGPFTERLERGGLPWSFWPLGNYRWGKKSAGDVVSFAARFPRCVRRLVSLVQENGSGLLWANGPRAFPAAAAAARWRGIPSVWHLQVELESARDRRLCVAAARLARPVVLACSRACLDVFPPESFLLRNARVLYPGVKSTHPSSLIPHPSCFVVGVIGRIHPDKGQDQVLRAAPQVLGAFPGARFRFFGKAGDGDAEGAHYQQQLLALAQPLGQGRVEFRGWVEDVQAELAQLSVLVVPSRREALARVILEAFACRVPVVAAEVGGIPEVVEPEASGLLYPPDDAGALADAIVLILRDAGLRQRLVEQAYQDYLARWRLERFQAEVLEVLRNTMRKTAAPRIPVADSATNSSG